MTSELTSSEYFELIGELIPELTSSQCNWKGNQKGKGTDETPQKRVLHTFMYIYIGIWWGWRNHKAELAIVQQPLSTKYDMEWNLLLFTTRLLASSVSTKGWRFMKKGLIFLMFLFFYVTARSNAELVTRWSKIDTKVIDSLFFLWHDDFLANDNK